MTQKAVAVSAKVTWVTERQSCQKATSVTTSPVCIVCICSEQPKVGEVGVYIFSSVNDLYANGLLMSQKLGLEEYGAEGAIRN